VKKAKGEREWVKRLTKKRTRKRSGNRKKANWQIGSRRHGN
jgi:hypothetical protein